MITDYEKLSFTNSFMFCNILQRDPELCKEIVETILDVKIREIIRMNDEESIKPSSDGHGVRLDVYLEDDEAVYDIEMQTTDTGSLQKRSRYYQGVLDTDYLKKGQDYNLLKKTFVIFVCTFDLFGRGLPKYTFNNVCAEDPEIELGDESTKVFVNARGAERSTSPRLHEFLTYVDSGTVGGELSERIEGGLLEARRDEGMRAKYMTFEWELATKYREGMEVGRAEGSRDAIEKLLSKMRPDEIIALGFSKEDVDAAIEKTQGTK